MTSRPLFTAARRVLLATALAAAFAGCATSPSQPTLADTIANTPELSTLNGLIGQAGLTDTLQSGGPYTVFAPSNEAFQAVPAKTMDELAKNPQKLKDVLSYHVVSTPLLAADVKNSTLKTLQGGSVAVSKAGDFVTVESAAVVRANLVAANGVVHAVDTVLLPPAKK